MNKFGNLANKLIKNKLWTSKITVIQLEEMKDSYKRTIYSNGLTKDVNCVVKSITKRLIADKFKSFTEFIISSSDLIEFSINSHKFALIYNGVKYNDVEVTRLGTLNNEDTVISFIVEN